VIRYRLRFLLQELDLTLGVTTIGRSVDCHVTLDDALASRRHARIVVGADRALIEDTGSRNGVVVNGTPIRSQTRLRDGDRVRVGTTEFVFCKLAAGESPALARTTGQLRLCGSCRQPYPREVVSCPACEAADPVDEDTLTGPLDAVERLAEAGQGSER
jgi:predicted component of type VI protein secretion system